MATKQEIYTGALYELGDRKVLTSEATTARRVLDELYDRTVKYCLEEASWNFAMETVKLDADTGVEPAFGYSEVFAKPGDWLSTHGISTDEYFHNPLMEYYDDVNYWSADTSPIYVRYVSNDTGMGLDTSRWPESFTRYVELELAFRAAPRLVQDKKKRIEIQQLRDKARVNAKNRDAMNEPQPKFKPAGAWTTSRQGAMSGRDRGRRNQLIG